MNRGAFIWNFETGQLLYDIMVPESGLTVCTVFGSYLVCATEVGPRFFFFLFLHHDQSR